MESLERDLEIIEEARKWFLIHLQGYPPIKVTVSEYAGGVSTLSEELRTMSARASHEICEKYGCSLTHNQASIALISAMNGLKLIQIEP